MKIDYKFKKETKSCYVFETGNIEKGDLQSLYLKKSTIAAAGINPQKGITAEIAEKKE